MSSLNNTYAGGIPSSIRNAIASSYSSSRGLSQVGNTLPKAAPEPNVAWLDPPLGSPYVTQTLGRKGRAVPLGAWQGALRGVSGAAQPGSFVSPWVWQAAGPAAAMLLALRCTLLGQSPG